ncbi:MAG: hypothetical protein RBT11_02880 [Desulfobacterales bacterium]|jgi:hypothetical protein|nr:hypothetical protein [Desulfobacterales bacterium]
MKNWLNRFGTTVIMAVCICIFGGEMTGNRILAEESTVTITGQIMSVTYGVWNPFGGRKATLVIQDAKRKQHIVYVGFKTSYIPHRTPELGDLVTIICIRTEGVLAGLTVSYN